MFLRELFCAAAVVAVAVVACGEDAVTTSEPRGWKFFADDGKDGIAVSVPHDWAIAGKFAVRPDGSFVNGGTGALPWRGKGRYEATFEHVSTNGAVYLDFGGVMAHPQVWVNGRYAGGWDYGYMSFALDVTQLAKPGANSLVVRCDTTLHNSRWYPGAGIFRPVKVIEKPLHHVVPNTMQIVAREVSSASARMEASCETSFGRTNFSFMVANPRRWDVDDPHLYTLDFLGEKFKYGIRTCKWTADDGFHLNGRRVQIKGVNLHSDFGPLGMVFHPDAARRQLLAMKSMGANALRTSHNPPARETLDLCDELGIVVWDECFDDWRGTAGFAVGEPWKDAPERNLRAFVRRDRLHPCVVAWSIGNEIHVVKPGETERGRKQLTRERVKALADVVRGEDAEGRAVAMGCHPGTIGGVAQGIWDDLDLVGWNYRESYRPMRERLPKMPLVISESASAVSSAAGWYENPPNWAKYSYDTNNFECSGYDLNAAPTLDVPDVEFCRVARDRYLAGEFVWTGIDYLGEPTPFWRESRSSYFGAMDLCVFPKDRYWLYRSHWNDKEETLHMLPHWTWPGKEGQVVPVWIYTSGDAAELFLNGRSLGRRAKKREGDFATTPYAKTTPDDVLDRHRLRWNDVRYEPGELKVVAWRGEKKIGERIVRTAGAPVRAKVTLDPFTPKGGELAFLRVALVDANGVEVPGRSDRMDFSLRGAGEIIAVGNGNAHGKDSFKDVKSHPLFCNQLLVVVRRTGPFTLIATAAENGWTGECKVR